MLPTTRSHRMFASIIAVILGVTVAASYRSAPTPVGAQAPADPAIHMVSRTFVPAPGIDRAMAQHVRETSDSRVHGLVQLDADHATAGPASRSALSERGVQLLHYVPDDAWLASLPADMDAIRGLPGVRAIVHLTAEDKRAPSLAGGIPDWARGQDGSSLLWVSLYSDVDAASARALFSQLGARELDRWPSANRFAIAAPASAVSELARADIVRWVSDAPPPKQHANDGARTNMGVETLQAAGGPTGLGVEVGEWDEGQVGPHVDLDRVTVIDTGAVISDHATHVAGTVVGSGTLDARARGIAPDASLFSFDWNNPVAEHEEAAQLGVDVSTNSWIYGADKRSNTCYGQYTYNAPDYDAITRGRYGKDILVLFAAGNSQAARNNCSRDGYDKIHVPATAKNIVTVGAINSNDDSMTDFSSWGPTDDGRVKPEVVGPGCASTGDFGIYSTLPNDRYAAWCGTSMATPATAGAAAILVEKWRTVYASGDSTVDPLPSTIKALLAGTADDLGNTGPDYRFGFGGVNVGAAADLLDAGAGTIENRTGLQTGDAASYAVRPDGGPLRVTLVWSDVEAVENASKTLVNDLDLVLIAPDGTEHRPWVLQGSRPEEPATRGIDDTNVVEQVTVESPSNGDWTARVSGASVPMGPQHYSLVIDGASPADRHDVAIAALNAPDAVATGFSYDIGVDVANEGTFDETGVDVVLEDTTAGTVIGTQTIDLLAGASASLSFTWNVPVDAVTGDHVLRASVGPVADETDLADNESTSTVAVREAIHDVAIGQVSADPATIAPGDVVQVSVGVLNEGDYDETVDVSVTESPDGADLGTQTVTLVPGEGTTLTFDWVTSANTTLGEHTLDASVSAVSGESDLADNSGSASVSVLDTVRIERTIANGSDDAGFSCELELALNEVTFGEDSDCRPKAYHTAGFRFADLQIPNGATIQSARLEFTSASNYDQLVTARIAMEDAANAEPFGPDRTPRDPATTSVDVPWDITPSWAYLERVASPDFSAVLQAVVNRTDWASGNAAAVIIDTQDASGGRYKHRRVFSVERDPAKAATLIVEYAP